MPRGKRSPDFTQISISLPKTMLEAINQEAEIDNRSRSNWIVTELAAAVSLRRKKRGIEAVPDFRAAGEKPSAGVGGPSSSSTRVPTVLPEPRGDIRLNEEPTKKPSGPRLLSTRGIHKVSGAKPK